MDLDPTADRQRLGLWLVAVALFAVLGYVVHSYVGTVVFGLFIYYVARPVYDRLRAVVPTRTLAALVALLVFILPVIVLFAWTLGLAVQELMAFATSQAFEDYFEMLEPYVQVEALVNVDLDQIARRLLSGDLAIPELDLGGSITGLLQTVVGSLGVVGTAVIHLFLAGVIGFYLLRDDYRLVEWANRTMVPEGSVVAAYLAAVDRDLKNVYFGNILNAFLTGTIAAVTYNLLNGVAPAGVAIPVPTLLGILTGAASLVPVVGIKLTYVPVLAYLVGMAALNDPATLWFPALFGIVSVVVVDIIPDLVLRPYVSGRTLHVGTLMVAYILGPLLFGWYGIFLGPLLLVAIFEFARIVVPWLAAPPDEVPAILDPASPDALAPAFVDEAREPAGPVEPQGTPAETGEEESAPAGGTDDGSDDAPRSTDGTPSVDDGPPSADGSSHSDGPPTADGDPGPEN